MEFPPPPTSAPLPPIPSSKRHDFSSRVSLFLVSDKQEGLSKALLKGSIFYLQRFLHRDRFSNACKKRDVACNWQDLSSVKFNRDPGFVVNFSKQTHNTSLTESILLHDLFGRLHMRRVLVWFLPSIKVLFIALKHNLRKREATSKFKNPLVLKVQFETGRPPCCSYQICVEVEASWRGSNQSSTV